MVDLALLEPGMVPQILGEDAETLWPTLLAAAEWAKTVAEGWARGENRRGGGTAGLGRGSSNAFVGGGPVAVRPLAQRSR